jgi:hypothetical protein
MVLGWNTRASGQGDSITSDPRLGIEITKEVVGVELSDLLRTLVDKPVLIADPNCSHLKVQLRIRRKPLRNLMQALAELVPGNWVRVDDSRFELRMEEKAKSQRARWWQLMARERERCMRAQEAYILAAMRRPNDILASGSSDEPSDEKADSEHNLVRDWYRSFPRSIQESVAHQIPEIAFMRATGPFLANAYPREGAIACRLGDLPASAQASVIKRMPNASPNCTINFSNTGTSIKPSVVFEDGTRSGLDMSLRVGIAPGTETLTLDHRALPRLAEQYDKSIPPSWRTFLEYQKSVVWKNESTSRRAFQYPPIRRSELLTWIAIKANMDYVSDYYSTLGRNMRPEEFKGSLSGDVSKELDFRALEHDMSWKKRPDGLFLFRSNRWYRDDYLEVENRILERLKTARPSLEQLKSDSITFPILARLLNWKALIVRTVDPLRFGNGFLWFHVNARTSSDAESPWRKPSAHFRIVAELALSEFRCLQFYAGLSPGARNQVLAGKLPVQSLSAGQRAEAMFLAPELRAPESSSAILGISFETPMGFALIGDPPEAEPIPIVQTVLRIVQ